MKKSTMEYIKMYRRVLDVLDENQSLVQSVPGFTAARTTLAENLQALEIAFQKQAVITHGARLSKDIHFDQLKSMAIHIKGALFLYGQLAGDGMLMFRHRQTAWEIKMLSPVRLHSVCEIILTDLQNLQGEIDAFGITPDKVQIFTNLIGMFEVKHQATRRAIEKRVVETKKIETLQKEMNAILHDQLDRFVIFLKEDQLDFFHEYKAARKVQIRRGKKIDRDDGGPTAPSNDEI